MNLFFLEKSIVYYFFFSLCLGSFLSCKTADDKVPEGPEPLYAKADSVFSSLNYQQAEDAYLSLLENKELQKNSLAYFHIQSRIAHCYWRTYESAKAYSLSDSLLPLVDQYLGSDHEYKARFLTIKGNVLCDKRTQQTFDQSVQFFEQALAIYQQHYRPPSEVLANAWERLAIAHFLMDDYLSAIPLYKKVLDILEEPTANNLNIYIKALANLGLQYSGLGYNERAIQQYEQARLLLQQMGRKEDVRMAVLLINRAECELDMGDWAAALVSLEYAWDIEQRYGDENSVYRPFILQKIGDCYHYQKEWKKARFYYQKSRSYWNETDVDTRNARIDIWQSIGTAYSEEQAFAKAKYWLNRADSLSIIAHGEYHINRVKSLIVLQQIARQEKEVLKAEQYIDLALKIARLQYNNRHPLLAEVYYEKALLYTHKKQWNVAIQTLDDAQRALQLDEQKNSAMSNTTQPQLLLSITRLRAQIAKQTAAVEQAIAYYQASVMMLDTLWNKLDAQASKHFIQKELPLITSSALELLYEKWKQQPQAHYFEQALWFANQNRSKSLRYEQYHCSLLNSMADSSFLKIRQLKSEVQLYEKLIRETKQALDSFPAAIWRKQLSEAQKNYKQLLLEQDVKQSDIEYIKAPLIRQKDLEQWSQSQASDLIVYTYVQNEQLHRLSWIDEQMDWQVLSLDQQIKDDLKKWEQYLKSPPDIWLSDEERLQNWQAFTSQAHALYQYLIPQKIFTKPSLVILADEPLYAFPFTVLFNRKAENISPFAYQDLPYWTKDKAIRYAYTLGDALAHKPLDKQLDYQAYVAQGGQKVDWSKFSLADSLRLLKYKEELQDIPYLPHASLEANAVNALLKGRVFEQEQATEQAFLHHAPMADILHVCSHAWVAKKETDFAALLLWPDEQSDGWLFSTEVANCQLSANLVVLSSCYAATGSTIDGEGVASIGRVFLARGCSKVLMSHWALDDESNAEIATSFFKYFRQEDSFAQAVQRSQLEYLENVILEERAHPFYWAALALYGAGE